MGVMMASDHEGARGQAPFRRAFHILVDENGRPCERVHALPGVITKDQDFEVMIEGSFVMESGDSVPFRIEERYEWSHRKGRVPMYEVWQDI